jgi:hypothetical protein
MVTIDLGRESDAFTTGDSAEFCVVVREKASACH